MNNKNIVLAAVSDTHGGFLHGLINPTMMMTRVDEEGKIIEYSPDISEIQKYLWGIYESAYKKASELAGKNGEIILVHIGDICHGNKYNEEIYSSRMADQINIAYESMKLWAEDDRVKSMFIISGTGVHEFGEGSAAIIVAKILKEKHSKKNIQVLDHLNIKIRDKRFDISHHGPTSGIYPWLTGNVARSYIRKIAYLSIFNKIEPPDIILRGHIHEKVDVIEVIPSMSGDKLCRLNVLPPMAFLSGYARNRAKSPFLITNGCAIYSLDNDMVKPNWITKTVDLRTEIEYGDFENNRPINDFLNFEEQL